MSSDLARTLEALLFLSSDPLSAEELAEATAAGTAEIAGALTELGEIFAPGARGLLLREVAGGYTLASDPLAEDAARTLLGRTRHSGLTAAQLETLAIVAYLQPVSRPEIARIRGVNAESPVATLLDRSLIAEGGRSEFGAVLYTTTPLFLKVFDLRSLEDLPDPSRWDASPEEEGELRDRLLAAGDARAGTTLE
ncbi:MAG TPA: SMC-Scp complex subunit ScpB [Solirubrobacteraceae bacterium]|nr:SMC-Scp complex subunit ScpB [Solirubrobacteraceae bacterium]